MSVVIILATRLTERAGVERFAFVHFEPKAVYKVTDTIISLTANDDVITKYTKLGSRTISGVTH
jgi:hypothetical protein